MIAPLKISVAMCTFNGDRYLSEQLNSIARQTLSPFELVVCDDGSTDDSLELLNTFSNSVSFPVRLYVNDENLGSTKNFEKAMELCTGDIIALADQDDVWLPSKLERIEKSFSGQPQVGVVFTDAVLVDSELRPLNLQLWKSVRFTRVQQWRLRNGGAADVLLKHNVVTGATMAFRASHLRKVLPIPQVWSHDAWVALLVSFFSRVEIIREPLILYRQHSSNQVGVSALKTKAERWKGRTFSDRCLKRITKFESVYERIMSEETWSDFRDNVKGRLESKIRHLKTRHETSKGGWRRILAIREFAMLRYHRFSERDRAFIADFFRFCGDTPKKGTTSQAEV